METKILIRTSGAAGSSLEFSSARQQELTLGRDPSCDVKFDPDDDLVSRRHARIIAVGGAPGAYTIADLGSRNGTFVNRQRIFEPVALHCGDHVQLGAGGPELEFDLDPRPAEAQVRPTRLADSGAGVMMPAGVLMPQATREAPPAAATSSRVPSPPPLSSVGRATVERMVTNARAESRKAMYLMTGGLVVVLLTVSAAVLYFARGKNTTLVQRVEQRLAPDGLTPTQIAQTNTDATVMIEAAWKLVEMESGKQLFHVVIPNRQAVRDAKGKVVKDSSGKPKEEAIAPGGDEYLPVFLGPLPQIGYQPLLSTDDNGGKNFPIGGILGGSGFVVSSDGFILTNRHVAAAWHARYGFDVETQKVRFGVLVNPQTGEKKPLPAQAFAGTGFIPAQAKLVTNEKGNIEQINSNQLWNKRLEGRNDVLDIAFPHNRIRIPAKISRVSDRMDVAMLKIDIPQTLKKVELNDNYETAKVGDPVVLMGYPAVSVFIAGIVDVAASKDALNQAPAQKIVADPTLSSGNISRIVRGTTVSGEGERFAGDFYQLTINSTGHGNSGGPMFDSNGKVMGIFTLGWGDQQGANVTAAIPIRYGMELMGVSSGVR